MREEHGKTLAVLLRASSSTHVKYILGPPEHIGLFLRQSYMFHDSGTPSSDADVRFKSKSEFSFFHTCRPGLCPATKPPSPGDVAQGFPSNADAGAGRDSAMFDSSRFHEAPGSLGASAVSPPRTITRRSPNLSQDERRYVSAGTTSEAFLPLTDEDLDIEHMRVWSSVPPLLDGEVPRQMKNTDTVDASRLNRYFGDSLHLSSGSEPIAGEHQRDCGGVIALHRLGSDCQPLIKSQRSSARFHEVFRGKGGESWYQRVVECGRRKR